MTLTIVARIVFKSASNPDKENIILTELCPELISFMIRSFYDRTVFSIEFGVAYNNVKLHHIKRTLNLNNLPSPSRSGVKELEMDDAVEDICNDILQEIQEKCPAQAQAILARIKYNNDITNYIGRSLDQGILPEQKRGSVLTTYQ